MASVVQFGVDAVNEFAIFIRMGAVIAVEFDVKISEVSFVLFFHGCDQRRPSN